ncbi:MAG: YIP1 family protein [Betaproteobacteria bacterium]|nr:YIP1 family protein [Betaproteobacteria bacterium]
MTNLQLAGAIVMDPQAAFADLQKRPTFWFPLLLIVLLGALGLYWYYSIVDAAWLTDLMVNSNPKVREMPEAQKAKVAAYMTKSSLMWSSLLFALIGIPVVKLLEALYYLLAAKVSRLQLTFKQGLTIACWSGLPVLIASLAMFGFLLLRKGNQINPQELQLLSLNELFFHIPIGQRWNSLLSALTILHPWMWWLTALGVRVFSGRSMAFSAVFVGIPLAIFYGGWAVISAVTG